LPWSGCAPPQQGRLPDPSLAAHHQRPAALADAVNQVVERSEFALAPNQGKHCWPSLSRVVTSPVATTARAAFAYLVAWMLLALIGLLAAGRHP
jgi:hypothetical protein